MQVHTHTHAHTPDILFIPVFPILPDIPEVSTTQTDQVLVSLGDNLLLSCDYNAVPTPDVTWLFDGQELQAASSATRSDLLLTAVAVEDGGVYTCTAMNLLGQNSVAITVAVTPVIGEYSCVVLYCAICLVES